MAGDLMPLTVRQDVLEWISAHPGLGARSAVSHFAPLAEGPERSRYVERVRMWMKRSPTRSKERANDPKGGARGGQKAPPRQGVPVEDLVSRSATPPKPKNIDPRTVTAVELLGMSPDERLEHHLSLTMEAVRSASPHTIAYSHAVKAMREATAEIDRTAAERARQSAASSLTPEQWAARVQADASQATLEDLEVYATELYRRLSVRPVHHHDGRVELVRVSVG